MLHASALNLETDGQTQGGAATIAAERREHVQLLAFLLVVLDARIHVDVGARSEQSSALTRLAGVASLLLLLLLLLPAAAAAVVLLLATEVVLHLQVETVGGAAVGGRVVIIARR